MWSPGTERLLSYRSTTPCDVTVPPQRMGAIGGFGRFVSCSSLKQHHLLMLWAFCGLTNLVGPALNPDRNRGWEVFIRNARDLLRVNFARSLKFASEGAGASRPWHILAWDLHMIRLLQFTTHVRWASVQKTAGSGRTGIHQQSPPVGRSQVGPAAWPTCNPLSQPSA